VKNLSSQKKELMSEKVYRKVRDMIAVHRFEPGFSLNVEKLSRELGVSRTPVWEAMRRLEQEGVVKTIPNRGVFMAKISSERILDVMEVRAILDRLAGRLACKRINKRMIDRLARCLPDQLRAIETADLGAYFLADNRFHRLMYEASGNSYLMELFESITLHMLPVPYSSRLLTSTSHQTAVYKTHQEVVEGLANRDGTRVETALARHTEIIITHINELARSETQRKEMVRRIEREFPFSLARLKAPRPLTAAEGGQGSEDEAEPFGKRKVKAKGVNRKK
jgi:DNA-binding GntR family transcriptional regulator